MRFFIAALLVGASLDGWAQYFQFSQYNFAPQRINPAYVATSDYASVSGIYRNQSTAGGFHLNSSIINFSCPLISAKRGRWSGVGLSVMNDRSGTAGIFNTHEAALSYAVNVRLSRWQELTLGAKVLYQNTRLDFNGLVTGAQYLADRGFDGALSNGENLGILSDHLITLSAGIHWQHVDNNADRLAYWDMSFFDFNKPDNTFIAGRSQLNSTMVFAGGARVYKRGNLRGYAELIYTLGAGAGLLTPGMILRCDLLQRNREQSYVDFIARVAVTRSGIFGFQYHAGRFGIGVTYDLPLAANNPANLGAFEVGLVMKKLVRNSASVKQRASIGKSAATTPGKKLGASIGVRKPPAKQVTPDSLSDQPEESMSSRLKQRQDSVITCTGAGEIMHEPFVVEKATLYFNFEFNSVVLDQSSGPYLDDLARALLDNPSLVIRLEGHTDNIGSARFNLKLSQQRAQVIKNYLIQKGISAGRVTAEGKGLEEPLNDNSTDEARSRNRRVELTISYRP